MEVTNNTKIALHRHMEDKRVDKVRITYSKHLIKSKVLSQKNQQRDLVLQEARAVTFQEPKMSLLQEHLLQQMILQRTRLQSTFNLKQNYNSEILHTKLQLESKKL